MDKYVLEVIQQTYKKEESGREAEDKNIHVSDLATLCPRKYALCHKHNVSFHRKEYVGTGMALTFELGCKIQDIVVNRLKKSNLLIGTWVCKSCDAKFFGKLKYRCPNCDSNVPMKYIDTKIAINKYGIPIVGNIDVLLLKDKEILLVEVKSIKKDGFISLKDAQKSHKIQLASYLWMIKEGAYLRNIDKSLDEDLKELQFRTDNGTVLYVCKEYNTEPYKTFLVNRDNEYIAEIELKLATIKHYIDTNELPLACCSSKADTQAKNCHMRNICFDEI